MKKSGMSATTLRTILSIIVIILIGLSAAGFYFGQNWLRTLAVSVSHTIADSKASGNDVQSLKKLQQDLLARQDIIAKANSIVSSSQNYQNQTIQDLDKYATDTGIVILNYNFTPPTATASAAPTSGAATATQTASSALGTGSTSVTVTLSSPVSYKKLLKFMTAIESNLPKMQISSINLGRVIGNNSDSVNTEQITVEVYTQ